MKLSLLTSYICNFYFKFTRKLLAMQKQGIIPPGAISLTCVILLLPWKLVSLWLISHRQSLIHPWKAYACFSIGFPSTPISLRVICRHGDRQPVMLPIDRSIVRMYEWCVRRPNWHQLPRKLPSLRTILKFIPPLIQHPLSSTKCDG